MTSRRPMIGLPSGWAPNTASPSTSKTLSCGSSSYMAISSRMTSRSASTSRNAGRKTMSAITSMARPAWTSRTREETEVVSLPVPAFSSAPISSKIWSISSEAYRLEPLNSRCSSTWERPACSGASARDPVAIQKPSATERTDGMRSVTIRSPPGRRVRRCSDSKRLRAIRIAVARAPAPVAPAAAAVSPAAPAVAAAAAAVAAAVGARADRGQLGDRLAGHGRVVGQAQADPPALAVDLDHAHGDLVALVEHVLDGVHALARGDVGDVQQAVGALGELDEGAEGRRLDDLAGELVADLHLLGHRPDAVDERVGLGAAGGVDQDLTLVVDVDLGLELVRQAADRLTALADEQADLVGVDLDR